ncbi:MAG: hypothetical protein K0Q79_1124 [Flavipsychrobacter sp.]|jgi:hypothetical protein|nr:hypothetical protein [Flavipsychrobacter sp.]
MIKNIFDKNVSEEIINRINKLTPQTQPVWGKMNVAQMLAHCCVTYEFIYDTKHKAPGPFQRFLQKAFIKNIVVNEKPYKKNSPTGKAFITVDQKNFDIEKARLIDFIKRTTEKGKEHFEGKESLSFGKLTSQEWNNMFYKHLDHHLSQFGV